MSEEEFQASLERAIAGLAADLVTHGAWKPDEAVETSRQELVQHLPGGRGTPHFRFLNVVQDPAGRKVGETWYVAEEKNGRRRFWIDWIWIEPSYRRQGLATEVFERLERLAGEFGADRVGLSVLAKNSVARAFYDRLGYAPSRMTLEKHLPPRRGP